MADCEHHRIEYVVGPVEIGVRGETVVLEDERIPVCATCKTECWSDAEGDSLLVRAYNRYRSAHRLLTPSEIRRAREALEISADSLDDRIGLAGEGAAAAFEAGALQTDGQDDRLRVALGVPRPYETLGPTVPSVTRNGSVLTVGVPPRAFFADGDESRVRYVPGTSAVAVEVVIGGR